MDVLVAGQLNDIEGQGLHCQERVYDQDTKTFIVYLWQRSCSLDVDDYT
jgi:hypothetical protein